MYCCSSKLLCYLTNEAKSRPTSSVNSTATFASSLKKSRAGLKKWARSRIPIPLRESRFKSAIAALDHAEESRALSQPELLTRKIIISILKCTIQEKMTYWRWRAKVSWAIHGGENTKFFHMSALQCLRKNKIFTLTRDGHEFISHHQKAKILHDFFVSIIGTPADTSCSFDLNEIYPNPVTSLHILDEIFLEAEIKNAFFQMNP